jgi:hypothetical protein
VLLIVHGNPLMMAGFDIVLYLDIAMQILVIGEDDAPPKSLVIPVLDFHPHIQRTEVSLLTEADITQRFAHCYIYIDRSPNQKLIDKLRETKGSLILIADDDYSSDLFIDFDSITPNHCSALSLATITENIKSLVSLYELEYQTDFFAPILTDEDSERWRRLKSESSEDPNLLPASIKPHETFHLIDLNKTQAKVASSFYYGTLNGLSKKSQHEQIGFSDPYYYEVLSGLRDLFFVKTYQLLFQKLDEAVKFGQLNL